jgi:hypothetical protein
VTAVVFPRPVWIVRVFVPGAATLVRQPSMQSAALFASPSASGIALSLSRTHSLSLSLSLSLTHSLSPQLSLSIVLSGSLVKRMIGSWGPLPSRDVHVLIQLSEGIENSTV